MPRGSSPEDGFSDIAAHGMPGFVQAYVKRVDAKTDWGVMYKSDGCSGGDIRLCVCFGAAEDGNGRSVAQELADISKKRVKAATGYFRINIDGSYYVGSDIGLSDGAMVVIEPGE